MHIYNINYRLLVILPFIFVNIHYYKCCVEMKDFSNSNNLYYNLGHLSRHKMKVLELYEQPPQVWQ